MAEKQFYLACENKNFDLARKLFDSVDLEEKEINFGFICGYGYLEFAKWMVKNDPQIDIHNNNEFAFRMACKNGKLDVCKWLYDISKDNNKINITIYKNDPIRKASKYGHINVVEWLIDKIGMKNFNIVDQNYKIFRITCQNNQLKMAQKLYNTFPIPEYILSTSFYESLNKGSASTTLWLLEILNIYKTKYNYKKLNDIFYELCTKQYEQLALWLIIKFPQIDYKQKFDGPFRMCCTHDMVELGFYLMEFDNRYNICLTEDGKIKESWISDWMSS